METNQILHKWMGRGCWHQAGHYIGQSTWTFICMHCGLQKVPVECLGPKYTVDLNAVRQVELKAIESFGVNQLANALTDAVHQIIPSPDIENVIFADARTRAFALVELIELSGVTGGAEDAGHAIA